MFFDHFFARVSSRFGFIGVCALAYIPSSLFNNDKKKTNLCWRLKFERRVDAQIFHSTVAAFLLRSLIFWPADFLALLVCCFSWWSCLNVSCFFPSILILLDLSCSQSKICQLMSLCLHSTSFDKSESKGVKYSTSVFVHWPRPKERFDQICNDRLQIICAAYE